MRGLVRHTSPHSPAVPTQRCAGLYSTGSSDASLEQLQRQCRKNRQTVATRRRNVLVSLSLNTQNGADPGLLPRCKPPCPLPGGHLQANHACRSASALD